VAAHGKLLWDPSLLPLAYATNVGEQFVYEIDLVNRTLLATYDVSKDLPNDGSCVGTHSIQYSSVNRQYVSNCCRQHCLEQVSGFPTWETFAAHANTLRIHVY
jgi:hypothetical protein